jgi:hypothetical protein
MLQGMTPKGAAGIVAMARSWLRAPKLDILSNAYQGGGYDQAERAYVIERNIPSQKASLEFTIRADKGSPLLNPAFMVRNWGKQKAQLTIDGRKIPAGKNYRQGIVSRPDGEDLVIWLRLENDKPMSFKLEPDDL